MSSPLYSGYFALIEAWNYSGIFKLFFPTIIYLSSRYFTLQVLYFSISFFFFSPSSSECLLASFALLMPSLFALDAFDISYKKGTIPCIGAKFELLPWIFIPFPTAI